MQIKTKIFIYPYKIKFMISKKKIENKKKAISRSSIKKINSVTVYSTPICPYCTMVKEFLSDHKIKFKSIDVSSDYSAAQEMVKKSGQFGVPVTIVNNKVIIGFDRDSLKKALKIKK